MTFTHQIVIVTLRPNGQCKISGIMQPYLNKKLQTFAVIF